MGKPLSLRELFAGTSPHKKGEAGDTPEPPSVITIGEIMAKFASVKIRERKKIKPPTMHSVLHNSRIGKEATYLLPKKHRHDNYHLHKISNANKTWNDWTQKIEQRYQDKHGRKLRSDAVRIEEGLIVLSDEQVRQCNPDEIWEKMQEFVKWFEERHNTEILSLDWHRDEGEIVDGQPTYNEHAHFFFADVDRNGNKVRSNWKRSGEELREMQDKIAELFEPLGFERGIANQKKEYRRPREQRQHKQKKQQQQTLAKLKDIQEENKRLRAALKESSATREQYAKLEAEIRELRDEAKRKELTIDELRTRVRDLESLVFTGEVIEKKVKNKVTKKVVTKKVRETWKERAIAEARAFREQLQKEAELDNKVYELLKELREAKQELRDAREAEERLKRENEELRRRNEKLEKGLKKAAEQMTKARQLAKQLGIADQIFPDFAEDAEEQQVKISSTLSDDDFGKNVNRRKLG